jgi:hypothetical protein
VGDILKHKSQICVNGSQHLHGRDFWEVYAPVVSWPTIHLMLLSSTILDLKQRQVDCTQAFPQAPLQGPVYIRIPQGWFVNQTGHLRQCSDPTYNDSNHYITLKHNLYGCKQAACNWFHHLNQGLLHEGFCQSTNDQCLFLHGCKQAACNWFHHLNQGLLHEGFCQSTNDQCLFLHNNCILIVYTGNCIIFC